VLEAVDGHVRGEVVDAVQRDAEPEGERLGRGDTHEQRAGEPRPCGHRHGIDVREPHPRLGAGPLDRGHHRLEVGTAGDLGHHAAEAGVLLDAAGHRVGEQSGAAHESDTGLVAAGLDAEHERCVAAHGRPRSAPGGRFMTTASTPGA
jgi:hypothetical protein